MKESEAIERLYNMKNKVDVALMNSKHEKGHWLYDDVQGTADTLQMSIKAIEKQIPKKTHKNFEKFSGVWCSCGKYFGKGYFVDKPVYCPNCGQKIDWSDEE